MKLLIKQRVPSWGDTYDIYDENMESKYLVKAQFSPLGRQLIVKDHLEKEIGIVRQREFTIVPVFDIEIGGKVVGYIKRKFSFLYPRYEMNYNDWRVEGDFMGWDYKVYSANSVIMCISKELLHWGNTYIIDFTNPEDEIVGLLLVLAIDSANRLKAR